VVKQLARLDILYVDEPGYLNLKPEQSNIFFKLMEEPYRRHSTDSTARTLAISVAEACLIGRAMSRKQKCRQTYQWQNRKKADRYRRSFARALGMPRSAQRGTFLSSFTKSLPTAVGGSEPL